MTDSLRELLPCPFCGGMAGHAKTNYREDSDTARLNGQSEFYFVNCIVCGADNRGIVGRKTHDEAAELWNRRALLVETPGEPVLRRDALALLVACELADEQGELADNIDGSLMDNLRDHFPDTDGIEGPLTYDEIVERTPALLAETPGLNHGEFFLDRIEDEGRVSGIGMVAQGFVFRDGTVALRWLTKHHSVAFYDNIEEVDAIHGHGGKTKISSQPPSDQGLREAAVRAVNAFCTLAEKHAKECECDICEEASDAFHRLACAATGDAALASKKGGE
jgi:hypothetical protein